MIASWDGGGREVVLHGQRGRDVVAVLLRTPLCVGAVLLRTPWCVGAVSVESEDVGVRSHVVVV